MRAFGCFALAIFGLGGFSTSGQGLPADADALPSGAADPVISAALARIAPTQIEADIAKLVSFGTRNTLSSMSTDLPPGQGINAAADWIESQFRAISATCGGCLEVKRDSFTEPGDSGPRSRILHPTRLTNVYAILHGTSGDKAAPWVLVTGHYDSRATDVANPALTAPGANDDASGVAVSLECARALSPLKLSGTVVFVVVAGEEQGLNGSRHLAKLAKGEGWPLVAVLNDDIVGGDTTPGNPTQDKAAVRVFSEGVPANLSAEAERQVLTLGAENDSPSRELARAIAELAPAYFESTARSPAALPGRPHSHMMQVLPAFHPVLVNRHDPLPARRRPHQLQRRRLRRGALHGVARKLQPPAPDSAHRKRYRVRRLPKVRRHGICRERRAAQRAHPGFARFCPRRTARCARAHPRAR